MTTTDTVVFDRVTKKYGDVRAVDEVSLTLRPGETVALLGPNGAGKSTTLDLLLGLKRPDSGTVALLGTSPREAVVAGRVGAMLQNGGLMGEVTVAGDRRPVSAARRQLSRARAARASPLMRSAASGSTAVTISAYASSSAAPAVNSPRCTRSWARS